MQDILKGQQFWSDCHLFLDDKYISGVPDIIPTSMVYITFVDQFSDFDF